MRWRSRHALKGASFRIADTILFGRYRILSTIGIGNSSTVYLAEHTKLNVYRAIKCIPKNTSLVTSPSLEATLLKNLSHPGIPIIYDIDEDEQFFYLIEEYIQGESLDTFVSHQFISHELILKFGIQLCEILDYLHHLMPYPILYQDLKPEHIIVCGDQLKLIDFGIASFFTGSGKDYQIFGTTDFAAPEALWGLPVACTADIYSLGKVLQYLCRYSSDSCSDSFDTIIRKATAQNPVDRYETVQLFKEALKKNVTTACHMVSHLTKRITVIGSRHGAGTTHVAVSLTCALNRSGHRAVYYEHNRSMALYAMADSYSSIKEKNGIYYHPFFEGIPDYGRGVASLTPDNATIVRDCGVYPTDITELDTEDFHLMILSGSPWDIGQTILAGNALKNLEHIAFLCNYDNQNAARKIASTLGKKVYCFPIDQDPFSCTDTKQQLFSQIFSYERRRPKFLNFRKRQP